MTKLLFFIHQVIIVLSTLLLCCLPTALAFLGRPHPPLLHVQPWQQQQQQHGRQTILRGVGEWRDLIFDYPGTGDDRRIGTEQDAPPREVNILPFPFEQVLLQGETKQLRLYEERFIKLFEDTMGNHCGVVAMGLLAQAGIIQKVPLCEIEAYNRMDNFGIFVTIRVVGRAQIVQFVQQEPYIKSVCLEIADTVPPNFELPNILAGNIRDSLHLVSKMERRLEESKEQSNGDDDDVMQRRINRAKLEDRFYDELDEDDDEMDSGNGPKELDRERRFETSYRIALATDTQGYRLTSTGFSGSRYTPQELTATSWAAFCTDDMPEMGATYRIQALDCDNLFERLKLASHMLKQKENQLKEKLGKAGLELDGEEEGSEGGESY